MFGSFKFQIENRKIERGIAEIPFRVVLMEQLKKKVLLYFQKKKGKQEKQETFPKLGNLTEGKMLGRLHFTI